MPANQLIFDRAALASGMKGADQQLFKLLVRYADDLLVALIGRSSFPDLVRAALRQSLLNRDTQVQTVARRMGLSTRTLQRQLRAQGSSFRGLLSGVRRELAEQYLRDPALGIDEVAYFLNFSQTSEFHRAFQAWTGTTPRRYRSSVTRA
jgi:AraC-like DNA-binding protein